MPSSHDILQLSQTEWNQLQDRADQFADALRKGRVTDWTPFLDGLNPSMRKGVHFELVKIDLDHRWSHGERPFLEEYIVRHPDLGDTDSLPVDLICEEFRIRKKRGGCPELADYSERFPQQFDEVKAALAREIQNADQLMETAGSVNPSQTNTITSSPRDLREKPERPKPAVVQSQKQDNYEKTEMLGHGNFGEVWKGKAPGGIEVAIKVVTQPIDRDAAKRELQALELVKNLRHPCLLTTSTFWIENDRLHIVMELADGSMRDRLKQCRKQNLPGIPRDELLMYFADAAEGLDFLHTKNVFHRDIKPDNILLLHGHAKVADFGLARLQERQMMTVSFAGTPVYMAPETWGGKGGPRSDQYSLAFAYAELRLGRRVIEASDFAEVMTKALEGTPDLSGMPEEEAKLVRRALAKKPEERFNNCSEFVASLARATGNPVRSRTIQEEDLRKGESDSRPGSKTYVLTENQPTEKPDRPAPKKSMLGAYAIFALLGIGLVGAAVWFFVLKGPSKSTETGPQPLLPGTGTEPPPKKPQPDPDNHVIPVVPSDIWLPSKQFAGVPGAQVLDVGGKKVYDQIEFTLKNDKKARFVLINPTASLKPYYMMENKVWDGLFAQFAKEKALARTEWRPLPESESMLPVTRINAAEAFQFASWIGGKLPSTQQWDYAAGLSDKAGREGPSVKEGTAAVGIAKPRAVDDRTRDVSPSLIHDMSGNGREFTRNILLPNGTTRSGPLADPANDDLIILRGRNFTLAKPLTYKDLEYEKDMPQTQYYLKASPYTSFRVVIEVD